MALAEAGVRVRAQRSHSAARPGDTVELAIEIDPCAVPVGPCTLRAPELRSPGFFPYPLDGVDVRPAGSGAAARDGVFSWKLRVIVDDGADPARSAPLRGVVALRNAAGETRGVEISLPFPRAERGAAITISAIGETTAWAPALPLLRAMLAGFLGGLLLNLMPCVLPILALKVFSLADLAERSRREVTQFNSLIDCFGFPQCAMASPISAIMSASLGFNVRARL